MQTCLCTVFFLHPIRLSGARHNAGPPAGDMSLFI